MRKAVAVISGGMDSTAMLYAMLNDIPDCDITAVSFNYGQKHKKELVYALATCKRLGISHHIINLEHLGRVLNSSLTNSAIDIPEGHYAEENMKSTVVPNRNMIMASIAAGIAVSEDAEALGLGVHAGDHFIYPDCRPDFVYQLERLIRVANEDFIRPDFYLYTPWLHLSKSDIVAECSGLDIPWERTWSCYKGDTLHCGKCGTCVERKEAFKLAGFVDPTHYEA